LLTDDTRVVIYNRHVFIVQATELITLGVCEIDPELRSDHFLSYLCLLGVLNNDPTVRLDGVRPTPNKGMLMGEVSLYR